MRRSKERRTIIVILGLSLILTGCGYGEVSPRAYECATALYSICNRRDEVRLAEFERLVAADRAAGALSDREADWLNDIIEQARAGDWQQANAAVRQMLEDQVDGP